MAETTPVVIPYSQIEYSVTFARPMFQLVGKFNEFVVPMIEALEPWGFDFEETDFQVNASKPRDHVVTFQRPSAMPPPNMKVAVKWRTMTVSVEQPDWGEAASIAKLCSAGVDTLVRVSGAQVQTQQINLMMHVQSETTPRNELTGVLLTPRARNLMDGEILGQGLILHRENASILIDNSAAFANGLFVRMQRTFDPSISVEQIGNKLLQDEQNLWELLGLEGEL